jgi:hypothetical protein
VEPETLEVPPPSVRWVGLLPPPRTWGLILKDTFVTHRHEILLGIGIQTALSMLLGAWLIHAGWRQERCIEALRAPGIHPATIALMCR